MLLDLKDLKDIKLAVKTAEEQLQYWQNKKTRLSSALNPVVVQGGERQGIEYILDKEAELEAFINARIKTLTDYSLEFEKCLKEVKPLHATILSMHYLKCLSYYHIADELCYSLGHVKRIAKEAKEEVTSLLENGGHGTP